LCPSCAIKSESDQMACSQNCAITLVQTKQTLWELRLRPIKAGRLMAYFLFATGIVNGIFGILMIMQRDWPFVAFILGGSFVFFVCGIGMLKIYRKRELEFKRT